MKKRQKKSNLGQLVLTCTDLKDLERQLQDDTELFGKKVEPFSMDLPDLTFIKRTLSLFPNVSEFDAIGGSSSADISWQSDSYYLVCHAC